MKKLLLGATAFAMLGLAAQAGAADHQVKMLNNGADGMMVFEPGYLKVAPGDTVTFVAADPAHNAVSFHVPAGAQSWSGAMNESVTVKLDQEGVYLYACEPHIPLGMAGVIQVGSPKNLAEASQAADNFSATVAVNKDRLGKYLDQVK